MKCSLQTRRGENAENRFKVVNHRGQLGHLHSEFVDPLWSLHADISVLVNCFFFIVNIKMKCVYNNYCKHISFSCLQRNCVF